MLRNKRFKIDVHIKRTYGKPGHKLGTISRVLKGKVIGNFNPVFCTYHMKEHLVKSHSGDLSDPFRRDPSYLNALYIEV